MKTAFRTSLLAMALFAGVTLAHADAIDDITAAGQINVGVFPISRPSLRPAADMSLKGYDMDVAQTLPIAQGEAQPGVRYRSEPHSLSHGKARRYADERRLLEGARRGHRLRRRLRTLLYRRDRPGRAEVKDKEDLADKSIAVNRGTLEDTSLTEAAPASADIQRFDNYNAVIQAFISGQTQLMVVGNDVGAQVLAQQVDLSRSRSSS